MIAQGGDLRGRTAKDQQRDEVLYIDVEELNVPTDTLVSPSLTR